MGLSSVDSKSLADFLQKQGKPVKVKTHKIKYIKHTYRNMSFDTSIVYL